MKRETTTIVAVASVFVWFAAGCSTVGRHVATTTDAVDAAPAPDPPKSAASLAPSPPPCGGPGAPCVPSAPAETVVVVDPKSSAKPIRPSWAVPTKTQPVKDPP